VQDPVVDELRHDDVEVELDTVTGAVHGLLCCRAGDMCVSAMPEGTPRDFYTHPYVVIIRAKRALTCES
jgi:hypothetical protein